MEHGADVEMPDNVGTYGSKTSAVGPKGCLVRVSLGMHITGRREGRLNTWFEKYSFSEIPLNCPSPRVVPLCYLFVLAVPCSVVCRR